jgi:hypothetical protein
MAKADFVIYNGFPVPADLEKEPVLLDNSACLCFIYCKNSADNRPRDKAQRLPWDGKKEV